MRSKTASLLVILAAGLALAGCGSSNSSAGASAAHNTPARTAKQDAQGANGKGGKSAHSGGLQVDTTPRYAKVPPSAPTQSGTVKIAYRNYAIDPDTVKVKVGSTIEWTNYDPDAHNVTSESGPLKFSSGNFGEGKTFSVKVTKPGVIHYECTLQPTTMNGTIEVVE